MLLEGLNEQQQEAVTTTEGPLLIIAGAGSGKTKALTHRIAYLIIEKHIHPLNVLAVTFTNKAANEMKDRLARLLAGAPGQGGTLPHMGTFHSICVRILRKEIHRLGYENSFTIFDTADSLAVIKMILKDLKIDEKQNTPKSMLNAISKAKEQLLNAKQYANIATTRFAETVAEVYIQYEKKLFAQSALDFDDLIMKTIILFTLEPEVLEKYQDLYRYIHVDEYQDTNHSQYTLIQLLADKYKNICVIGDDYQSIYSWRGANMGNILNFEKDFPGAKVIKLERNYRSTDMIIEAANEVIKNNKLKTDKTLWTDKKTLEKICIIEGNNERHECDIAVQKMHYLMRTTPASYKDFAVLYRTNAQSRVVEESMLRHGIPYKIVGGVKFYERKEIKDILAYTRLINNPKDDVSLMRIINVPSRKLGDKSLQAIEEQARALGLPLYATIDHMLKRGEESSSQTKLKEFYKLIEDARTMSTTLGAGGIIKYILTTSGYKEYLKDGSEEGEERLRNVEELVSVASKYDGLEAGLSLTTFLEEVALVSDLDKINETDNAVTLMTLHSSKGLEFSYVFIIGCEENLFPHSQSLLSQDELEEERRLMYVGITRAREKLFLSYALSRMIYGDFQSNNPSRFLEEIPEHLIERFPERLSQTFRSLEKKQEDDQPAYNFDDVELEVGDHIMHKIWGEGSVISIQGNMLTVIFQDPSIGTKKIAATIAPIWRV